MATPCPRGPSLLTPQLRDGPERGLAFRPAGAAPPHPPARRPLPSPFAHFGAPRPPARPPFLVASKELPSWACHPRRGGGRGPTSRALHPPRHPSFYSKALTVIWGLAPASPQPLAPKRPGIDRATGHGWGPGLGGPCCRRPGHPHPNALSHMQCLVWDPVNRCSAKPRPFPIKVQGEGCPRSPPSSCWPVSPRPLAL